MVPESGIEPLLPKQPDFESSVSTSFTTQAHLIERRIVQKKSLKTSYLVFKLQSFKIKI